MAGSEKLCLHHYRNQDLLKLDANFPIGAVSPTHFFWFNDVTVGNAAVRTNDTALGLFYSITLSHTKALKYITFFYRHLGVCSGTIFWTMRQKCQQKSPIFLQNPKIFCIVFPDSQYWQDRKACAMQQTRPI
jgi:hypothetical protein